MSDLPLGWEWATLNELVEVLDHKRVPVSAREREGRRGNIPYFGATGQVGWIDQKIFDEDLILLGEDGVQFFDRSRPKAYTVSGPSWVNNHAHVLRTRSDIDQRYVMHYLNHFDYHGYATGTTRLKLTQAQMNAIPILVPPAAEQRRIADAVEDHLSRLDAGSEYLGHAEGRLASLPIRWLTHFLTNHECDVLTLGGMLAEKPVNGRSVRTDSAGFPVLRLTALKAGTIDLSERKNGAWTARDAMPYLVQRGDFLLSRGNGSVNLVGRGGLVRVAPDPVAFPDTMIRIRVDEHRVHREYLSAIWNSQIVRGQIESQARTTAGIFKINQAILQRIAIPVPLV